MKITNVQVREFSVPLIQPFKTALRTVTNVNNILVVIETNTGLIGYGEAAPTAAITGETKASIISAINDYIAPSILDMDIEDLEEIMLRIQKCIVKNTSAKAAVDMAVWDLFSKQLKKPLYKILGGCKNVLKTDITISIDSIAQMVINSIEAVQSGYSILKIKTGSDAKKDLARIEAISQAVGPAILLRIDANQGWSVKESIRIIHHLEEKEINIDCIEQPVRAHDLEGMQYITSHSTIPIAADESIFSSEDARRILGMHAADILNIKLMKTGGIYQALTICHQAKSAQINCMIGCMIESSLSVSAAAHLAASQSVITRYDLDAPILCTKNAFIGGCIFSGEIIGMPKTNGIGISV